MPWLEHEPLVGATVELYSWVFRGHWDDGFIAHVGADSELLLDALLEIALRASLLRVDKPYAADIKLVVRNAAGEFARFVQHYSAPVYPMVQRGIRRIFARYDPTDRERVPVWIAAAPHVFAYEDCADYDLAGPTRISAGRFWRSAMPVTAT